MRVFKRLPGGNAYPIACQDIERASIDGAGVVMLCLYNGLSETIVSLQPDEINRIIELVELSTGKRWRSNPLRCPATK